MNKKEFGEKYYISGSKRAIKKLNAKRTSEEMAQQVEEFKANGGKIEQVDNFGDVIK